MSTTTLAVVNGVLPTIQDVVDERAEFEKILKLRDEIFAGNHPRLTVPAHLLRKFSPSPASSSHSSLHVQAQPQQLSSASMQIPPGLGLSHDEGQPAVPTPNKSTPTASGIDPVLLTKSDGLVRAETAMLRGRLEKQLRDQFEQKRLDFRKKPAPAEAKPDFDISSLLAKALESVKPLSLEKEQSDKDGENDSVDENSFYSSRAPDSTPERGDGSASSQEEVTEEPVANEATVPVPRDSGLNAQKEGAIKATTISNPFKVTRDRMDVDNDDEEGEYSPPEADQYPAQNTNGSHVAADPRSRQVRRYSDLDQNGKRPASPSEPNMRIVRNHITSPVAPQPSRVSPLTFTKDSLVSQGRQHTNGRPRGRAESPSQSPENVSARNKRRKVERKAEKRAQRRGIKQENVSPPPFHDIQPLGAKPGQPEDRTIVIDEPPAQPEPRYIQAPRYIESPQRPLSRQADPNQMASPRVLSRNTMRPREEPDLRRVASMHNMRLEQPREYVEYAPARQRATSYIRVDSPLRDLPRDYASDTDRPLQEVRVIRTPAPEYREIYQPEPEVRYIPEPMPPPPRERIVVDQYGRRFREIIQERPSVTPRASSFLPQEAPQYYDEYPGVRAGSVMVDERAPAPRYVQDMPPPRVMRQQIPENQAQPLMSAPREVYDAPPSSRAASVAVYDRPQRQVVYTDAPDDFRPPPRMTSVRPQTAQYEEQPMIPMGSRAASVRPGIPQPRQASVYIDDRIQAHREYLPVEQPQPRYRVVDTEPHVPVQRYVDAQGREIIPTHHDGGVRYVQRY